MQTAGQPNQPFPFDRLAETGLARAENNEIGVELQVVQFLCAQEPVARFPVSIDQRQHNGRQRRSFGVEKTMRRESG